MRKALVAASWWAFIGLIFGLIIEGFIVMFVDRFWLGWVQVMVGWQACVYSADRIDRYHKNGNKW